MNLKIFMLGIIILMADWQTLWRDWSERPLAFPLFSLYRSFMDIRRYEHMPFYFYPQGVNVVALQDRLINVADWAFDAHEEGRNPCDLNRSFYARSVYVMKNFLRYQNSTMCNVMFDTQASRRQYARLNSVISQQNLIFYLSAAAVHMTGFAYMSYFFRYRRVGFLPILAISSAYYCAFESVNNTLYKLIVDKPVLATARSLGLHAHAQPCGQRKNRGFNYV